MEGWHLKIFYAMGFLALISTKPLLADSLFTLGGKSVSVGDLSPAQQQQLFEIESQSYEQMRASVDKVVLDMHFADEAKKQNKSRDDLEKAAFDVKDPTDKAVKTWYEANKANIPPNYQFDQIKPEIVKIVKQEEMKIKRDALLEKVKKEGKFAFNLAKPVAPIADIKIDGYPSKGKDGAKVTVIEFADFQCSHCKAASESFKKVAEKMKDKIKYVYIDFPLNSSGISKLVAEGSHCAADQNKYWEYHYKAFETQSTLDKDSPAKLAKDLKLDEAKFKACFDGTKGKAMVEKARQEGDRIGVSGTPYVLINGRRYLGAHTVEALTKEIDTYLK
jgi:protein-disulfide isomerase